MSDLSGQHQRWAVYVRWPSGRRETIFTAFPAEVARLRCWVLACLPLPQMTVVPGRAAAMTAMNASRRHWRSDGTEPLPSGAEAMSEPFAAFPSWSLRIECDRCGKVRMGVGIIIVAKD